MTAGGSGEADTSIRPLQRPIDAIESPVAPWHVCVPVGIGQCACVAHWQVSGVALLAAATDGASAAVASAIAAVPAISLRRKPTRTA